MAFSIKKCPYQAHKEVKSEKKKRTVRDQRRVISSLPTISYSTAAVAFLLFVSDKTGFISFSIIDTNQLISIECSERSSKKSIMFYEKKTKRGKEKNKGKENKRKR